MTNTSQPDSGMASLNEQALDWFVRRRDGLSAGDESLFQAWLEEHPAHAQAYAGWERQWSALDAIPALERSRLKSRLSADRLTARRAEEMTASTRTPPPSATQIPKPASGRFRPRQPGWRLATSSMMLALVLVAAVGVGHLAWDGWMKQPLYSQSFVTERGKQLELRLPDGSSVRLDTATRSDIALFRQRREVKLTEGQAVFQVQADPKRPFDVLAGPLRITVVGTRFAVRYTPGTTGFEGVRVLVEEGVVRVSRAVAGVAGNDIDGSSLTPGGIGQVIELRAGQQVSSDSFGRLGKVTTVPATGIAPWRENRVSFDDTPLNQALAEFERYGSTGVEVRDPAVAALRVTGTFDPRRLDNFARLLPQALPVKVREYGGHMEIQRR